jgi:LuxR family maltose regulon positive regulatory protein
MDPVLILTKLQIPPLLPRKMLVPRQQIWDLLDMAHHVRLILVSAPAGAGKTTTISAWLHQQSASAAWFSLDENDNEPKHFWQQLVAALQATQPGIGLSVEKLIQNNLSPISEAIAGSLINDLARQAEELFLVLDDYHLIANTDIHTSLTYFIDRLPAHIHVLLLTRSDPSLPLARWRVRRALVELRAHHLRFDTAEATVFLNQVMDLDLPAEDIATLEARTEGWIAGLQLAALAMQTGPKTQDAVSRRNFVQAFAGSHRHIVDYLLEEVIHQQPEARQTFLLQTSILEWMNGPLCDAVTGGTDSAQQLEQLDRANLFLQPLDGERQRYRYHHLFAELLRLRMKYTFSDNEIFALYTRAAEWLEAQGKTTEALGYALKGRNYPLAARLLWQAAPPALLRGEVQTVRKWVEAVPEPERRSHPAYAHMYAWVLLLGREPERVDAWLQIAENLHPPGIPDEAFQLVANDALVIRTLLAGYRGDYAKATQLGQAAIAKLPDDDLTKRSIITLIIGDAYRWDGDMEKAQRIYRQTVADSQQARNYNVLLQAQRALVGIAFTLGRLRQAEQISDQVQSMLEDFDSLPWLPAFGTLFIGKSQLAYERNRLDEAQQFWEKAQVCCDELSQTATLVDLHILGARIYLARGETQTAQDLLNHTIEVIPTHLHPYSKIVLDRHQVLFWAATHQTEALKQWLETAGTPDHYLRYAKYYLQHTRARVLVALASADPQAAQQARDLLETLQAKARSQNWQGELLQLLLLQAKTYQALNNPRLVQTTIQEALSLGEPEGYLRTYVDEGEVIAQLLDQLPPKSDYVNKILGAFQPEQRTLPEGLTPREMEVLTLIAKGYINQEIADQLVIAVSTVKTHINNIFSKLDVSTRTQAIVRGQELGLF